MLVRAWGLHSATNLLPSTVLHRPHLGRIPGALYRGLCTLDRALAATGPGRALANSLVILAEKSEESSHGHRATVRRQGADARAGGPISTVTAAVASTDGARAMESSAGPERRR